ncbi:MAG: isoprenyl transferase [Bacteroidales bacterium]
MTKLKEKIDLQRLPKHIAIIMDGNGRWAQRHNRPRVFGHQNGVNAVRESAEAAAELGVGYLTLYAFSTENWKRPEQEINALMELLIKSIHTETDTLIKNDIRLNTIGDLNSLPEKCQHQVKLAMEKTANNNRMTLNIALNYSGKWDITQASKKMARDVKNQTLKLQDIDETTFSNYLSTAGMPDIELLLRTSGEQRISNFLLWQIAYAELYFTHTLWPDFSKKDLYEAILSFQCRERRFGKTSQQLIESKKCE